MLCLVRRTYYYCWILLQASQLLAVSFIPVGIQDSLSACAQPCVSAYIYNEFSPFNCQVPPTLDCLCSQYSNAGPALGNIVTACTVSACTNQSAPQSHISFDYCQELVNTSTSSVNPTATMPPAPTVTPSAPASAAAQVAAHPPPAPPLSPAQITGVAIGAAAVAVIVFFLIAWLASHLRRRKIEATTRSSSNYRRQSGNSRFGVSDKELAPAGYETVISEKSESLPRAPPAINTSFSSLDPAQIGVAVSPESRQPNSTPVAKTPVSAQSTDSTAHLLPQHPPPNIKVTIPPFSTQRRRAESTATVIDDHAQDMAYKKVQFPSPPSAHTERFSPLSPEDPVELPCNNPLKASRVTAAKLNVPPPIAVRAAPPIPIIKKQAADRTSTQTIISNEPMSPKSPAMNPFQGVCPSPTPFNPGNDYIPSYYYTSSPTASAPPAVPPKSPKTAAARQPQTPRSAPRSASSTLANSATPPKRPQRTTPPPLPPPPSFGVGLTSPPAIEPRAPKPSTGQAPRPPPPRRGARDSTASAASAETVFDDQDTPVDEPAPKPLSPVAEAASPQRAAADSRPGSRRATPPRPASPAASSIIVKRKGSDAADEMQKGLWITGSNGRTVSERGRFPVRASSSAKRPPAALPSPVWTPSLTPRRTRSGDLVLEVE